MLDAPDPEFLPDTVNVYERTEEFDEEGSPVYTDENPTSFACAIHRKYVQLPATGRIERFGGIEGQSEASIFFAVNPGVEGPDHLIEKTHHNGVELAAPERYRSRGKSEVEANGSVWIVHAQIVTT